MVTPLGYVKRAVVPAFVFYDQFDALLMLAACSVPLFMFSEALGCGAGAAPAFDMSFWVMVALTGHALVSAVQAQIGGWRRLCLQAGACGFIFALLVLYLDSADSPFAVAVSTGGADAGGGAGSDGAAAATRIGPGLLDRSIDVDAAARGVSQQINAFIATVGGAAGTARVEAKPFDLSPTTLRCILALFGGLIFCAFVLPAHSFSGAYHNLLTSQRATLRPAAKMALHGSFFLPLIGALGWIHPLTADLLCPEQRAVQGNGTVASSTPVSATACATPSLTLVRMSAVFLSVLTQLWLMRTLLQASYDTDRGEADDHLERILLGNASVVRKSKATIGERKGAKADAQKASALQTEERIHDLADNLQKKYQLVCWRALQSVVAPLTHFGLLLLLKSRAGYDTGLCDVPLHTVGFDLRKLAAAVVKSSDDKALTKLPNVQQFLGPKLALLQTFKKHVFLTPEFHDTFFGFLLWWSLLAWFTLCMLFLLYWQGRPHEYQSLRKADTKSDTTTKTGKLTAEKREKKS